MHRASAARGLRAAGRALLAALLLAAPAALPSAARAQPPGEDAVSSAGFATGFENEAPRDRVHAVSLRVPEVFYVSDLRGLEGRTVLHRWSFEGRVEKEVRFEVDAPRWRAVSRQALGERGEGAWTVDVVDAETERVLRSDRLRCLPEQPATEHTGSG